MDTNTFARHLRRNMTDAEQRLWYHLRARRCLGLKFRRQCPIEAYIVDFVCFEKMLVVEVDGGQHSEHMRYDDDRTRELKRLGFSVIRFWNDDVLRDTEAVLEVIRAAAIGA